MARQRTMSPDKYKSKERLRSCDLKHSRRFGSVDWNNTVKEFRTLVKDTAALTLRQDIAESPDNHQKEEVQSISQPDMATDAKRSSSSGATKVTYSRQRSHEFKTSNVLGIEPCDIGFEPSNQTHQVNNPSSMEHLGVNNIGASGRQAINHPPVHSITAHNNTGNTNTAINNTGNSRTGSSDARNSSTGNSSTGNSSTGNSDTCTMNSSTTHSNTVSLLQNIKKIAAQSRGILEDMTRQADLNVDMIDSDEEENRIHRTIAVKSHEQLNKADTCNDRSHGLTNSNINPSSGDGVLHSCDHNYSNSVISQTNGKSLQMVATDTVTKETEAVTKETDAVTKVTDAVTKETDTLTIETDTVIKETDAVTKETDAVTKETDAVTKETDTLTIETDTVIKETDTVSIEADAVTIETDAVTKQTDTGIKEREQNNDYSHLNESSNYSGEVDSKATKHSGQVDDLTMLDLYIHVYSDTILMLLLHRDVLKDAALVNNMVSFLPKDYVL